jgi:ankyrin repeat protein
VQLKPKEVIPPPTNTEIAQRHARKVMALARKGDWNGAGELLKEVRMIILNLLDDVNIVTRSHDCNPQIEGMLAAKVIDKSLIDTCCDQGTGNTLMMYATIENKIEFMGRLLHLGAQANKKNLEKYTALHFAAMYSREDTIQFLLQRKADPNLLAGPMKQTCVHLASARMSGQSTPIVDLLLMHSNKDVRYKADLTGNIPLFCAIEAGNTNVVRKLLASSAEQQVQLVKEPVRDSPMHLAVRKRDSDMCKTLVEAGAGVDGQNEEGQTPLHLACIHGCADIIRVLFLARANVGICDKEDKAPIYMAAERGHTRIVEFLIDKFKASVFERSKDGSTLMHIAALNGHPDTAMVLYDRGVPLLMPNKFGERSIHTAAKAGHVNVVKTLIKKGENVNAMTQENQSPLHIAVENGQSRVVETLLGYGADVQLRGGKADDTALHIAARIDEGKGERCTKQLVKSGADPNAPMGDGRSAVHNAASNGNLAVLRVLLQNGGDAQLGDKDGETGLHLAAKNCHFTVVQELLQFIHGFIGMCNEFVNRKNNKGETALHYAAMISKNLLHYPDEDKLILRMLMENGADVTVLTEQNKESAFHYVSLSGKKTTFG